MVSIIVPSYNYAHFLPEALNSILKQTYSDWECVIVNDSSTDNTEEVAMSYCKKDKRFSYHSKANGGPASARNLGIANTTGQYILPLDPDDFITPEFLEQAVAAFEQDSTIKIVASNVQMFGDVNEVVSLPAYDFKALLIQNYLFNTSMYKRGDFLAAGGYDESIFGFEDWNLWIGLLKRGGKVVNLPLIGYHYRIKNTSVFKDLTSNKKRMFKDLLKMYNNHSDAYEQHFDTPVILIQKNEHMIKTIDDYHESNSFKLGAMLSKMKNVFKS